MSIIKQQIFLTILSIFFMNVASNAQQALFGGQQIISPEIGEDHSVTFRFVAPNADSIQVTGDFLPTVKMQTPYGEMDAPGKADLVKGENGIWTYKTQSLSSELYSYSFIVDGLTTTDPSNPFLIRDVASVTNIFINLSEFVPELF